MGKIVPSTRSRIAILTDEVTCNHRTQSCASSLHLQSYLSKRWSNVVRKTLDSTTCAKSNTQKKIGNRSSSSPYVTMCRLVQGDLYGRANLGQEMSEAIQRMIKLVQGGLCGILSKLFRKSNNWNWSSSRRSISSCYLTRWRNDERNQRKVGKWKMGSSTNSFRNDLSKGNMIFSEESSRGIYDMGNTELIELRQTSATMQCLSCLKHVPEGLNMCQCGVWLRPNLDTMDRIKGKFAALITQYCRATIQGRGRNHGHNHW